MNTQLDQGTVKQGNQQKQRTVGEKRILSKVFKQWNNVVNYNLNKKLSEEALGFPALPPIILNRPQLRRMMVTFEVLTIIDGQEQWVKG